MDHFRHLIVGLDVLDLGHFDREDADRLTTVEYHHAIEVSGPAARTAYDCCRSRAHIRPLRPQFTLPPRLHFNSLQRIEDTTIKPKDSIITALHNRCITGLGGNTSTTKIGGHPVAWVSSCERSYEQLRVIWNQYNPHVSTYVEKIMGELKLKRPGTVSRDEGSKTNPLAPTLSPKPTGSTPTPLVLR